MESLNIALKKEKTSWILLLLSLISLSLLTSPIQDVIHAVTGQTVPLSCADRCDYLSAGIILFLTFFLSSAAVNLFMHHSDEIKGDAQRIHLVSAIIFIAALFIYHLNLGFRGDDLTFQHFLDNTLLSDHISLKYHGLTSRLIIEPILIGLTNANPIYWRIFDTLFIFCLFEFIVQITIPKEKQQYAFIVYLSFLFIPTRVINDAGWCATTLNYIWPLVALLYIILKLVKTFKESQLSLYDKTIMIVLSLCATNMELVAVLLFCYCSIFIFYQAYNNNGKDLILKLKKIDSIYWVLMIICVLSLIFILTCPGNASRTELEIPTWYPNYKDLTLGDKLELGVISTFPFYYCSGYDYPFNIILLTFICLLTFLLCKRRRYKTAALLIPSFIIIVLLGILPLSYIHLSGAISNIKLLFFSNIRLENFIGIPPATINLGLSRAHIETEVTIYLCLFVLLLYCVYKAFSDKNKGLLVVIILCSGCCTRLLMGFSPTVYGSGTRTFLFFTIAIIISFFFLLDETASLYKTEKFATLQISKKYLYATIAAIIAIALICFVFIGRNKSNNIPAQNGSNATIQNANAQQTPVTGNEQAGGNQFLQIESCNNNPYEKGQALNADKQNGLLISGWAIDPDPIGPLKDMSIQINGQTIKANYGIERSDVVNAFKLQCDNKLGFNLLISADLLKDKDGQYTDNITIITVGSKNTYTDQIKISY